MVRSDDRRSEPGRPADSRRFRPGSIPDSRFPIPGPGSPDAPGSPGIAVLALQGDFDAHRRALSQVGIASFEARRPRELEDAAGLVIPGGESTTLWKFFEFAPWEDAIRSFAGSGRPVLGTCAGAIVLAREVTNPPQRGLALVDMTVERNAYGRQADSFLGEVDAPGLDGPLPAVFIRAPRITSVGRDVEVLATRAGEPVLVRQGSVMAATFHPELTGDSRVHRLAFAAALAAAVAGAVPAAAR